MQSAYSNYPNEINTFALERADELRLELESPFFTGDGGRFYDESRNSIVGDQLIRFANEAEKNRVDFTSIDKVMGLDVKTENFGLKLERALMDDNETRFLQESGSPENKRGLRSDVKRVD